MPEKSKLRAAAIGVGSLGRHHARNYAELSREGRVEFVGVCDVDAETASRVWPTNTAAAYSPTGAICSTRWTQFP